MIKGYGSKTMLRKKTKKSEHGELAKKYAKYEWNNVNLTSIIGRAICCLSWLE
jgi:hypothetical protein